MTATNSYFQILSNTSLYSGVSVNFMDGKVTVISGSQNGDTIISTPHEDGVVVSVNYITGSGYSPPTPTIPVAPPADLVTLTSGSFVTTYSNPIYTFGQTAFYNVIPNEEANDGAIFHFVTFNGWKDPDVEEIIWKVFTRARPEEDPAWRDAVKQSSGGDCYYWNHDDGNWWSAVDVASAFSAALNYPINRMTASELSVIPIEQWLQVYNRTVLYVKFAQVLWSPIEETKPIFYGYDYKTDSYGQDPSIWIVRLAGGSTQIECEYDHITCSVTIEMNDAINWIVPNKDIKMWVSLNGGTTWEQIRLMWSPWTVADFKCPDNSIYVDVEHNSAVGWNFPVCPNMTFSDQRCNVYPARSSLGYGVGYLTGKAWKPDHFPGGMCDQQLRTFGL